MKTIKYIGMLMCIAFSLSMLSCKDKYFTDGGTFDPAASQFDGTTMAYLESKPQLFDSVTTLIKLCNLTSAVNASGSTFFAPQNYSVFNYLKLIYPDAKKMPKQLSDLTADDLSEIATLLKGYIVPNQRIMRKDLATSYSYYDTYVGKRSRCNIVKEDYLGNVNKGASYIMFGLNTSSNKDAFISVKVVVSDVSTQTGVVQVVAADTHILGFK